MRTQGRGESGPGKTQAQEPPDTHSPTRVSTPPSEGAAPAQTERSAFSGQPAQAHTQERSNCPRAGPRPGPPSPHPVISALRVVTGRPAGRGGGDGDSGSPCLHPCSRPRGPLPTGSSKIPVTDSHRTQEAPACPPPPDPPAPGTGASPRGWRPAERPQGRGESGPIGPPTLGPEPGSHRCGHSGAKTPSGHRTSWQQERCPETQQAGLWLRSQPAATHTKWRWQRHPEHVWETGGRCQSRSPRPSAPPCGPPHTEVSQPVGRRAHADGPCTSCSALGPAEHTGEGQLSSAPSDTRAQLSPDCTPDPPRARRGDVKDSVPVLDIRREQMLRKRLGDF